MTGLRRFLSLQSGLASALILLVVGTLLAAAQSLPSRSLWALQGPSRGHVMQGEPTEPLSRKQQQKLLKYKFDKMREDADELAVLAKSLQEDLDKSSENILSLQIVEKAEKIERLAKKIKGSAKGY